MKYFFAALLLLTQTTLLYAAGNTAEDFVALRQALAKIVPTETPDSIRPSPFAGLYEVAYGAQIFYASKDGHYLIRGDLIDMPGRSNLTDARRSELRLNAINKISEDQMIIFAPAKVKHTITVFTDIDCSYCRQLQSEIDSYLNAGIRVRYLSYPRAGVDTPSYYKAVSVWCAKDRKAALTRAEMDQPVKAKTCANPVKMQMALGDKIGVSGTPTIITDTGQLLAGYMSATQLTQTLSAGKKK